MDTIDSLFKVKKQGNTEIYVAQASSLIYIIISD